MHSAESVSEINTFHYMYLEYIADTNYIKREEHFHCRKNNVISTNVKPSGCFAVAGPIAAVPTNWAISFENAVVVDHATHNTAKKKNGVRQFDAFGVWINEHTQTTRGYICSDQNRGFSITEL